MESILLGLIPLVTGIALLLTAFRAHERYWALGFMGWRRVYAGLVLFLFSAVLTGIWPWLSGAGVESATRLTWWQVTSALSAAAGIGLVLAGAIERLRELSEERERLNDVRAGFDLFDSLRDISAQPYAFLEILDFSLKEIVRAAGAECGGVWLFNPGRSEWVLTGWGGMSEKLRQQTESVRGSGTGFDRLAVTHKARLFRNTDEIRAFFPEWEPEGYQSVLGLPLATGTIGTPGRQILGVIILADRSPSHFDDDRARRLYAASDYIAAVIAEARITRQLDAARQQLDSTHAEWERDRQDAQRQREAHEKRVQELRVSWEEERQSIHQDHEARMAALQTKAEAELAALRANAQSELAAAQEKAAAELATAREEWEAQRQELQKRHKADVQTHNQAKREWLEERHALEINFAAQAQTIQTQARDAIDQTKAGYELKATAAAAAEQERTAQMQQRWEDARRDHEATLARFETERAEWGRRLDQINQDRQAERAIARKREEQLTAANQETQAVLMQRIDDLQSMLLAEQQKVAKERDALQVASNSVAELESALTAERIERETELAAAHLLHERELDSERTARQTELDAIKGQLEGERRNAVQERLAVEQELTSTRQLLEEREKQLSAHLVAARQAATEAQTHYQESLESQQQAATKAIGELNAQLAAVRELKLTLEQELHSTRLMFDEREREFLQRIQTERRALQELDAHHTSIQSAQQESADEKLQQLEQELHRTSERIELLQSELQNTIIEAAEHDERARQELVEHHLNARRQINGVKTRRDHLLSQLQAVLGAPADDKRLALLFGAMADELPGPVELYLWQRNAEGLARIVAWLGRDHKIHQDLGVEPWSFEFRTIPAEGVTRLDLQQQWENIRRNHEEEHYANWRAHWGEAGEPSWAVCWPWQLAHDGSGANGARATGWLTAFGFGATQLEDEHTALAGQWVAFLAAAGSGMSLVPIPFTEESTDLVAPDNQTQADGPPESPEDLNSVILGWAAAQTEDALHLDLSARSKIEVEPSWLKTLLDRGRRLCRDNEMEGSEFSVLTLGDNGRTTLRLIRSSLIGAALPADVTAVDDSDLTGMQVSDRNASASAPHTAPEMHVGGRWLIRDGDRLGLELLFDSTPHEAPIPAAPDAEIMEHPPIHEIVLVNFQSAMNDLIVSMLESLGHHVQSADVPNSMEMITPQVTDLAIVAATPDANGWEFAGALKEFMPTLPVIVVTGDEAPPESADAASDLILRIPFQIEELQRAIERLAGQESIPHAHQ